MEERKQFTFYLSIFKALRKIKKKPDRADAYDAICAYALFGEEPDLEKLPDSVSIAFELIRPVLDASRRKAKNGKQGGIKCKQTESKPEANASKPEANDTEMNDPASEGEKEKEKEKEKKEDTNKTTHSTDKTTLLKEYQFTLSFISSSIQFINFLIQQSQQDSHDLSILQSLLKYLFLSL